MDTSAFLAPEPEGTIARGRVPSFSVVIACYQAASFVGQAVESALRQTLPPLEVIVCDDGSTDGTRDALATCRDRIVLVRQEHRGVGAAKNTAARAASGDFVVVLDADDLYLPDRLAALGELAARRPDLDILTTDSYLEIDGRTIGRWYRGRARFVVDDQRRGIIHNDFVFGLAAYRRTRFLRCGGYDEALVSAVDSDLHLRLILDGAKAGLVDVPLCRYRLRERSVSSDRVRSYGQGVLILERQVSHPSLSRDERAFLLSELAIKRRETALLRATASLRARAPDARRRSLAVATGARGYGVGTRLKALAAAAAPRTAARYLERLERRGRLAALAAETRGR